MTSHPPNTSSAESVHPIDYRRLSWTAKLVRDYCHAFERLEPFFVGSPMAPSVWENVIRVRQARSVVNAEIAAVSIAQLQARGAPPAALTSAKRLADPATVAVVTGQQAGLFGGPVFTLLKALTAIKLAQKLSTEHSVNAVPVLWVHAEDHDLEEISQCGVLTTDFELRTVTIPHESPSKQPASAVHLTDTVLDAISEMRNILSETEFSGPLFEQLSKFYRPGVSMVDAFSRWMDVLLGPHGLVVFDGSDIAAKPLARTVFDQELAIPGETSRLAAATGAELLARGYHAQVEPRSDAVALFYLNDGRCPIRLRATDQAIDDGFDLGSETVSADWLIAKVTAQPELLSPNVLLRPIVQDAMFPTVAYVAGPNELAYLAQLRHVYEHFNIPMPVMYPRASATIVDPATLRFLARYEIGFETLQPQDDAVLNRLLAALLPDAVEQTLLETERAIAERLSAVSAAVSVVDSTLVRTVDSMHGRMNRDLQNIRGKIVKAAKRQDEMLRRQFHRARSQAFPTSHPQERAIGFVYFLNRYGPNVIDRLLADLPLDIGKHWLMTV